jgi:hypothetical protein
MKLAEDNFQSWTFWDTCDGFEFWNQVSSKLYKRREEKKKTVAKKLKFWGF